ncbi:MAG: hypothetical protein KDI01_09905 [Halioglobus sp.]|nr:hypothetical protein [Halioglobus sp.]
MRALTVFVFAAALGAQQRTSLNGEWTIDGKPVRVPGAFETALGVDFDGIARYRRELPLPAEQGAIEHVRIEFAAVATHATVLDLHIEGGDESAALEAIKTLIENRFDETE